jgi:hypothetical protein
MRLILLVLIAGVAAYFTVPARAAFETQARAVIAGHHPSGAPQDNGFSLDEVVGFAKGMIAGQGEYQSYYVFARYTADMPGADYLECYGAFTIVKCQVRRS